MHCRWTTLQKSLIARSGYNSAIMIRRALVFLMIFAGLQFGWQLLDGSGLQHLVVDKGIVTPAAWIASEIMPTLGIRAVGHQLSEPGGGLNIVSGCDGIEALILLIAGFAVAPLPLATRCSGILAGIPVVYVLNQARILALFFAHHHDRELFEVMHGIVTPLLMVVGIILFFYLWLGRETSGTRATP